MLDNTKDPREILEYCISSSWVDGNISKEQSNKAWKYLQALIYFEESVCRVKNWAQNNIPGNIEASNYWNERKE